MLEPLSNSPENVSPSLGEKSLAEYWLSDDILEFPPIIGLVEMIVEVFRQKVAAAGWEVGEMDTALQEALNNAVAHGSLGLAKVSPNDDLKELAGIKLKDHPELADQKVRVTMSVAPEEIQLAIVDQGEGFNSGELPDPLHPENLLKTSGRGIWLMRQIFDEVIFNEKGNEVTLIKRKK